MNLVQFSHNYEAKSIITTSKQPFIIHQGHVLWVAKHKKFTIWTSNQFSKVLLVKPQYLLLYQKCVRGMKGGEFEIINRQNFKRAENFGPYVILFSSPILTISFLKITNWASRLSPKEKSSTSKSEGFLLWLKRPFSPP